MSRLQHTFMGRVRTNNNTLARLFSSQSKQKVVVIGGVAGGATFAARASRLTNGLDITVVERSPDVSFANCGLPYYLGREIADRSKLALQTPESLSKQLGIRVFTNTTATQIDRTSKQVRIVNTINGEEQLLPYDKLVFSTGASPLRPSIEGIHHPKVLTLRNLQDMDKIDHILQQAQIKRVAVIGAGFIGLEVAEQLHRIHKEVHIIERAATVLPQADPEISEFLHAPLVENGINLHLNDGLASIRNGESPDTLSIALSSGQQIEADVAILCIGVSPESALAKDAKLTTNAQGYVTVNDWMQTNDPNIYAVGDVIESRDMVFPERRATVALGNIANMQARIAADHMILGKSIPYPGSLGTSIVRVFDTALALTGWSEKRLKAANIPYATTVITAYAHASYYPGATPITMKMLFDPSTGRILGAQAVGVDGVDKRIDVVATAIQGGLTVDDISLTQVTYSPPFGSARDVVNVAGLASRNIRDGLVNPAFDLTSKTNKVVQVLDVRPADNAKLAPLPNSINIPYPEVASKVKSLDPNVEYRTVCAFGKTAYFASRELLKAGVASSTLIGGLRLHDKPVPEYLAPAGGDHAEHRDASALPVTKVTPVTTMTLDCSGLACPGPLLKLKESLSSLPNNAVLKVTATDPGFRSDVRAFANSNGLKVVELTSNKGIFNVTLAKEGNSNVVAQKHEAGNTAVAAAQNVAVDGNNMRKGATIVVFSEEFDKVLASFVIANGAAAMGGEVTMFFTFWGLNALRDPKRSTKEHKDLIDKMFGSMMPKGQDKLPLSHMNFGGMGAEMMKYVMHNKHLPNLPDLIASAKSQKIRMVACTMSMEAMGIRADELIDGVEMGGVADYLGRAEKSGTNLFI